MLQLHVTALQTDVGPSQRRHQRFLGNKSRFLGLHIQRFVTTIGLEGIHYIFKAKEAPLTCFNCLNNEGGRWDTEIRSRIVIDTGARSYLKCQWETRSIIIKSKIHLLGFVVISTLL